MNNLVSVIVPTYNSGNVVSQTIDSVLCQTYKNFELIIVDDGSTDNTQEVIGMFDDKRIRYFKINNSGGAAKPRNFGIERAKGNLIAFCDADDIWTNNKLEIQIEKLEQSKCDFISSNMYLFKNNIENITGVSRNRKIKNIYDFLLKNQINTSTVLVRKNPLLKFNDDLNLTYGEDYELWLKLYQTKLKFEFINEALVYYRIWDKNISIKNWVTQHLSNIILKLYFLMRHPSIKIFFIILIDIQLHLLKYISKTMIIKVGCKKI